MRKILVVLYILFISASGWAQTYYFVSPNGDDANKGTIDSPWKTIQYSLNNMPPHSVLNVGPGVYHEKIQIPINDVMIKNQSSEKPIIDATGLHSQNAVISIIDKNNVVIEGLELRNNIQNFAKGILIDGASQSVTIRNCDIHDIHFSNDLNATATPNTNANGIIAYGTNPSIPISDLFIENNKVYNCRLGYSEGITVNGNVDGFELSNNQVYNLTNIGIDVAGHHGACRKPKKDQARNGVVKHNIVHHCISPYATSGGIYVDGGKNIIIEYNTSYHNGYGISVGCENIGKSTDKVIVRNNILYDNQIGAIDLGGYAYPNGSGKVTNTIIRNNTCFFNDFSRSGIGELYLSYSENTLIENNIFYTNNDNHFAYAELSQPNLRFDYNLFYAPGGKENLYTSWNGNNYTGYTNFVSGTLTNTHSTFGNPHFISGNIINPDFHLLENSLAIDKGNPRYSPNTGETDFFGEIRMSGGIVDCGADEYGNTFPITASNNGVITTIPTFTLTPNGIMTTIGGAVKVGKKYKCNKKNSNKSIFFLNGSARCNWVNSSKRNWEYNGVVYYQSNLHKNNLLFIDSLDMPPIIVSGTLVHKKLGDTTYVTAPLQVIDDSQYAD